MTQYHDPRLDQAKLIPMRDIADRLGIAGLRAQSGELVGPCPLCGGRDRFAINLQNTAFNCRKCDLRGYGGILLVMVVRGVVFKDALAFLCGQASAPP